MHPDVALSGHAGSALLVRVVIIPQTLTSRDRLADLALVTAGCRALVRQLANYHPSRDRLADLTLAIPLRPDLG